MIAGDPGAAKVSLAVRQSVAVRCTVGAGAVVVVVADGALDELEVKTTTRMMIAARAMEPAMMFRTRGVTSSIVPLQGWSAWKALRRYFLSDYPI